MLPHLGINGDGKTGFAAAQAAVLMGTPWLPWGLSVAHVFWNIPC